MASRSWVESCFRVSSVSGVEVVSNCAEEGGGESDYRACEGVKCAVIGLAKSFNFSAAAEWRVLFIVNVERYNIKISTGRKKRSDSEDYIYMQNAI